MNLILCVVLLVFCTAESLVLQKSGHDLGELEYDAQITLNNSQILPRSSVCFSHDRLYRKYLGCYRDNEARMFKRLFKFGNSANINHCVNFCKVEGYVYAGLQFDECFCGNKLPKNPPYPKVNEDQCHIRCKGAEHEFCGGHWANSVFETGNQIFVIKSDGKPANMEDEHFWPQ